MGRSCWQWGPREREKTSTCAEDQLDEGKGARRYKAPRYVSPKREEKQIPK